MDSRAIIARISLLINSNYFLEDHMEKDSRIEDALVEDTSSPVNSWKPRPTEKKSKSTLWILISIVVLVVLVACFIWFGYNHNKDNQGKVNDTNHDTAITQEIIVGDYADTDEIISLKQDANILFGEQIQAYFLDDPNKDEKIEEFETKMNQIMEATHSYYVVEKNGGWEVADSSFVDFLKNLKYEDAIPLSEESIPYYLEKLHNIGE